MELYVSLLLGFENFSYIQYTRLLSHTSFTIFFSKYFNFFSFYEISHLSIMLTGPREQEITTVLDLLVDICLLEDEK